MNAYHYDGSPCCESCPCASREVERLRAQLEAVTRERDAARESEARMRAALEGLLSRPVAKPGWSAEWDALVEAARAALSAPAPEPSERILNTPQPAPVTTDAGPEVWPALLAEVSMPPELRALCEARDLMGRSKYGTPLRVHNGREPLVDALQEALDLAVYLHQATMRPCPDDVLLSCCRLRDRAIFSARELFSILQMRAKAVKP